MRQRMPVNHASGSRLVAGSPAFERGIARSGPRKIDKGSMLLSAMAYFGAICVIGWVVMSLGDSSESVVASVPQVVSAPAPAPTVAPAEPLPDYIDDGSAFDPGEGAQTADFWTSGPNPAIPPSQDPLTRQHY